VTTVVTEWETVVGLEVHTELRTVTKLFCGCRNAFGSEPNTNVCPNCLGLPGSLPVLNRYAVELAVRIGSALHCSVVPSIFHRKNYFYPDMPKDYQISQYDRPINVDGSLELPDGTQVGIVRAHIEEDTGKTTHAGATGRIHGAEHSLVDYNRAGVPLVEVVSAPDIRSAEQAKTFVSELRAILVATGASDGKMEEGSLRIDANVSVRRTGSSDLGTRSEIKNMNSLRSLGRAVDYEAARQIALVEAGGTVVQETRHWDEGEGRTHSMRSKEEAYDYRYFPEPDLVPLEPTDEWISEVAASLPTLPAARRAELARAAGLSPSDVAVAVEKDLDALLLATIEAGADPRVAITHAEQNLDVAQPIDPAAFARVVTMQIEGALTATQAKVVLAELQATGAAPDEIAKAHGFEAMDDDALATVVDEIIAANPDAWAKFVAGDAKVRGFFVGQVMRATQNQADGAAVTALLRLRVTQ
jgi:aspartyl-tRNA(Asn)/glutamyl-tRNA(Gln) amidotransferase subunit B